MSHELLLKLDDFRDYLGSPIFITCGTQGEHAANSQHYQGKAVDVVFPDTKMGLLDRFIAAERFGFRGIGIYPEWKYQGRDFGGLHLDVRPLSYELDGTQEYQQARWICYEGNYYGLTHANLKGFGII